jgi:RNA-directed DNA polymerase
VYCHIVFAMKTGATWALEGDIKACFDGISHEWLLAHVRMDKTLLRKWLKAGFMERGVLFPTDAGTPQGGVISPVLANMALDGLEQRLLEAFPSPSHGYRPKAHLARFADDFIITGVSKDLLEHEVRPVVEACLHERGLELSTEKTRVTHIEEGFDFRGLTVRRYANGGVLTRPSKQNVHRFLEKVRDLSENHKALSPGTLILLLNPLIQGWAEYHRFGSSSKVYGDVDAAIFHKLWRWARRRHPKTGAKWVRAKYFRTHGNRNWVFSGEVMDDKEQPYTVRLWRASDVHIQRRTLIRGKANPYDPSWETCFEQRLDVKMERSLSRRRKLLFLWKEHQGLCPICQQKITRLTGWHSHPVVWRSKGGSNHADNRVLLHPTCHMQVHSQGLTVSKPRPARGVGKA